MPPRLLRNFDLMPKSSKVPVSTKSKGSGGALVERFLAQAPKGVRPTPLRADPVLAQQNVSRGVENVMRREIEIRRALPRVDVKALRSLPDLARAVVHAAEEVARMSPPPADTKAAKAELRKLMMRARTLRELLLTSAESLVAAGVLGAAELAKIRSGLGPLDSARDCLALAALFRKHHGEVRGKTPVAPETIDEAERVGAELSKRLEAAKAQREPTSLDVAVATRDKLWTLLLERHDILWRVGAYVFGRDVDRMVPPLQADGVKAKRQA